jgi:hypothetical protein
MRFVGAPLSSQAQLALENSGSDDALRADAQLDDRKVRIPVESLDEDVDVLAAEDVLLVGGDRHQGSRLDASDARPSLVLGVVVQRVFPTTRTRFGGVVEGARWWVEGSDWRANAFRRRTSLVASSGRARKVRIG